MTTRLLLLAALLLGTPLIAAAQTATKCMDNGSAGYICYDFWDESDNAYDHVDGWLVERNPINGDYAECYVHMNMWTGYKWIGNCSGQRGGRTVTFYGTAMDPAFEVEGVPAPGAGWTGTWGGVRCDDRAGQNALFGEKVFQYFDAALGGAVLGAGRDAIKAYGIRAVSWRAVLGYGVLVWHYQFLHDFSSYFWTCYLRH